MKKILPNYHQHVDIPTHKDGNTLDHCYSTIKDAYKSVARPSFGNSDHKTILLIPTYQTKLKSCKPTFKTVRKWTDDTKATLQNCLETSDWEMFKSSSETLDEYTDVVSSYISFCFDNCIPAKTIKIKPNDKDWVNQDFKDSVQKKFIAFKNNDEEGKKRAKYDVKKSVRRAKAIYGKKLEKQFTDGDAKGVWNGVQKITQYKKKSKFDDCDPTLPDKLNEFYGRFDQANTNPPPIIPPADSNSDPPFTITESDVRKSFKNQNIRKAAGPDGVAPSILKNCAEQLAPVFTDIFNQSLRLCKVPSCFKRSTIVPVPKKAIVSKLNDYRPVTLTSVTMKVFERFVLAFLQKSTAALMDPHQFAYRSNRSVDDAVALGLHYVLQHLENPHSYARILFVDYSSAFNTIIQIKLYNKLLGMNIHKSICEWLLDFLLFRPQSVRIGDKFSNESILNTGAPQGCVLSPLLFTLFTNDCVSQNDSVKIIKFSDDTTVEGLISDNNEYAYRDEVGKLVDWCQVNNFELNVSKTKEIIVDFRKKTICYYSSFNQRRRCRAGHFLQIPRHNNI